MAVIIVQPANPPHGELVEPRMVFHAAILLWLNKTCSAYWYFFVLLPAKCAKKNSLHQFQPFRK
ncbi:hypothetical protein C7476_11270 [Phyllobacterium bourgognense]|uniref:Uncharacterized protein n=1 Tax=Phyllobacterium bourgognense TaxID=314236 RepID=A0A368YRZ2_9HYPH|nr:hypothetical protein C7476_11270 [Phyllobacterium bourgognense]